MTSLPLLHPHKASQVLAVEHRNQLLQKQVESQALEIAELKRVAEQSQEQIEANKSGKLSRYSYSKKDYETVSPPVCSAVRCPELRCLLDGVW